MGLRRGQSRHEVQQNNDRRSFVVPVPVGSPIRLELNTRWWLESSLIFYSALKYFTHAPWIITLVLGCAALESTANKSRHLHFSRCPESGLVVGCCLVPMVLQAYILHHPSETQLQELLLVLNGIITGSIAAILISINILSRIQTTPSTSGVRYAMGLIPFLAVVWTSLPSILEIGKQEHSVLWLSTTGALAMMKSLEMFAPQSFTLGEASTIVQGSATLVCGTILRSLWRPVNACDGDDEPCEVSVSGLQYQTYQATTGLIVIGIAVFIIGKAAHACLQLCGLPISDLDAHSVDNAKLYLQSIVFQAAVVIALLVLALPWISSLVGEPFLPWIFSYIWSRHEHMYTLAYWATALGLVLPLIEAFVRSTQAPTSVARRLARGDSPLPVDPVVEAKKIRQNKLFSRKLFHLLASVMFLPVLVLEPLFLQVSFAAAFALLMLLELLRVLKLPPVRIFIDSFMEPLRDEKDPGPLILTHLFLLLSCAIPVWLHGADSGCDMNVASVGILSVGIGDAAASVYGMRFGRTRWPGTSKTVEGSLCSLSAQVLVLAMMIRWGGTCTDNFWHIVKALTLGTLFEALTMQSDNLSLPVLVYTFAAFK
eukprot:m.131545 g.131545  ORF g.131545 m.131545 type:complete len:598 (-) comp29554_c0_seq4:78-1871(-)